ncbi:MAG: chemotaxis protein CheX [Verrucomicrobiota bacterium]
MKPEEFSRIFVQCISHYFERTMGEMAVVGTPYMLDDDPDLLRHTGSIPVSGRMEGAVSYTLEANLLRDVAEAWGEENPPENLLNDLVGEIANTIAGNARQELGHHFLISVPQIVDPSGEGIQREKEGINMGIPVRIGEQASTLFLTFRTLG